MRTVVIGLTPVAMQGGVLAMKEYRDEFDRSMMADAFGGIFHGGIIDYELVLRCAWAMAKNADPDNTKPYEDWVPEVLSDQVRPHPDMAFDRPATFMREWGSEVVQAIKADIFRLETPETDEAGESSLPKTEAEG